MSEDRTGQKVKSGIYGHWKDAAHLYWVIGVATNRDTGEQDVIYRNLWGDMMLEKKPLHEFTEWVDKPDYSGPRYFFIKGAAN